VGADPEQQIVSTLAERARTALAAAAADSPPGTTYEVVAGDTVRTALEAVSWREDDVLVIGSSGAGPLRRVFLGDMSFKLVRAAPVPAMVVPRRS